VIPSRAPLTSFAPQHRRTVRDSTPVGAEMNLIFVAGYGVDCYGGRALERAATIPGTDTRLCNDDRTRNEAALGDARRAYDGMAPALQALECQDGIPDTMWTNIQSETSGDRDHPNARLYSALTAFRASYVGMNPWDVVASVGRHPWLNRFWFTCGATSGVSWTCPDNGDGTIDYGALEALHAAFRDRDPRNVVVEVPGASGGSCAPLVRAPLYLPCSMTGGAPTSVGPRAAPST
jgi:hypothetical protein